MKLTGVVHTLGGFHTIRGFAPLADIARISEPEEFQRELIPEHKEEIKEFYRKHRDLFFPEVVLSYTLRYDFNADDAVSGTNPITDIVISRKEFASNVDKIKFKPLQTEVGKQRVVEININDEWLVTNKPFSRIDGNHRISAFLEENEHSPLEQFSAPFCIILFPDNADSLNSKKVIFHNINSKAKPLTTEEELKGIIGNENFSDEDLKERFGLEYYQTKLLINQFSSNNLDTLTNIKKCFYNRLGQLCINTVLYKLITFLRHNSLVSDITLDFGNIIKTFEQVNIAFDNKKRLVNTLNSSFLISAVGLSISKNYCIKTFSNWLSHNQIGELLEINAQSLYDIYLKVYKSSPKIFVAMPFDARSLEDFQNAYDNAVSTINQLNPNIGLSLYKIMTHKGEAVDIVPKMISEIEECTIFIADISEANPNVAYELGFAKGLKKSLIFVQNEDDKKKVPFDYTQTSRHVYTGYADLTDRITTNLKVILTEKGYELNF